MALATNQITYLQLIDMFAQFASDHYQINSSGNGAMSELVESQEAGQWGYKNYPIFWVIDDTPVVEFDDGQLLHNFQIVVADIDFDKKIKKNTEAQIKSNMMYIYQDFLAYLKVEPKILGNDVRIFSEGSSSGTSFVERFDDNLVGLVFNLTIKQPIKYNLCQVPKA